MAARDPVLGEISAVLARPASDDDAALLERALTDGYARVLSLETDRVRLDKQITRLALAAGDADGFERVELARLARRRERGARDLARLRTALSELRARYSQTARGPG